MKTKELKYKKMVSICKNKTKAEKIIAKAFNDEYAGRITTQDRINIERKYSIYLS